MVANEKMSVKLGKKTKEIQIEQLDFMNFLILCLQNVDIK